LREIFSDVRPGVFDFGDFDTLKCAGDLALFVDLFGDTFWDPLSDWPNIEFELLLIELENKQH
jgi:hypothetical protein